MVGIVGPNGCGKSNIIDAVRWVLGESRASELRGESMQDVIFNGSSQRKPAARASVELVFDNSEGRAMGQWSTYAEIAVRRILTRDGTSTYLLNNQQVRRRDIHDVFLGTGLGVRGYAIIGQGMINRLIEARPEELRVFLEEAAGVSRYKERRRETETRLTDTRENLVRVEDILRELQAQLERLESQAQVALRYRALQQEGEQKQHALWLQKEAGARDEQKKRFMDIERAQSDLEAATARLRAGESTLESRRQAHYVAGDAVHAAQGLLYEAGAQVSRFEAETRHMSESRARLESRCRQLHEQCEQLTAQQTELNEQLALSESEQEVAAARSEEALAMFEDAHGRLPAIEEQLRQASDAREAARRALARLEQERALSAQAQGDAGRQLQALGLRKERLHTELHQLEAPDTALLERLEFESAALEDELDLAQGLLAELEERLPGLDQHRDQLQAKVQGETQALARLEARLLALEKLQEDVQKQGALEPWLAKHDLSSLEPLWQKLHIEPGWETALEAILRERMSGIGITELEDARGFEADAPPARFALYQLPAAASGAAASADRSAGSAASKARLLSGFLRLPDPGMQALLRNWLDQVYVCASLSEAMARRCELADGAQYVVKEGHVVDSHSVRFYAPDSEQAGLFARQQEIENLRLDLKARRLMADEAHARLADAQAAWQQGSAALVPARTRVGELTARHHEVQLEYARLRQQALQAGEKSLRLQNDLGEVQGQIEELLAIKEEAEARFETLDIELEAQQSALGVVDGTVETLARGADAGRQRLRELERMAQECEFAERSLQARILELQRNLQQGADQVGRAHDELEVLTAELSALDASVVQAGLHEALEIRAAREEALRLARIELDELATLLRTADEERLALERSLEPQRTHIMELQLQEQAARLAVEQFAEQLDGHRVDRDKLRAVLAGQGPDWSREGWLQSEVQRIARAVDALGSVNLAALEELNVARERKNFLDAQHEDLTIAMETLEDAIRKIDRDTRALLQETFDSVNRHFGELFPLLFGGGEARLVVTGDEILDAGVQVMAQPPGKRNSTIHLLSGGEKALTATALVFALFKLNPAPFCLLDEVDAPLDDANTERYANLVTSMSEQTQFLFISHNKIAMQMARQLVGVTMQEQGVSRIVAVDIDSALQLAEV